MRRDMDLVRSILLMIDDSPLPYFDGILELEGYSSGQVTHHLHLLMQASYVNAHELNDANTDFGYLLLNPSLTWHGHEFLNQVRDPEIWRKTKEGANQVGSWSISLIFDLAKGLVRQRAVEMGFPVGGIG